MARYQKPEKIMNATDYDLWPQLEKTMNKYEKNARRLLRDRYPASAGIFEQTTVAKLTDFLAKKQAIADDPDLLDLYPVEFAIARESVEWFMLHYIS